VADGTDILTPHSFDNCSNRVLCAILAILCHFQYLDYFGQSPNVIFITSDDYKSHVTFVTTRSNKAH